MRKVCILLHGYLGDEADFGLLPKSLKPHYDKVIICQMPGHVSINRIYSFTFEETVKMLYEVIESYTKDSIVDIIGYSLGGVMASYLAKQYNFNKVVLISPSIKFLNFSFPKLMHSYMKEVEKSYEEKLAKETKEETKNLFKADFGYIWYRFTTRFTFSTFKTFLQFIDANNKLQEKIKSPLLVIRGELDELVPKETVETILNSCVNPVKEYIGIPKASHLFLRFSDQTDTINRIVKFLVEDISDESKE